VAVTGDTLTMPDGTSFSIVESAVDSSGKRIGFEITMAPGALGPPKHFHPRQDERWSVLEGELSVFVDGDWRTLGEGESLSIAPNVVHTLRNRSGDKVRFRDVHEPASAMVLRGHRASRLSASRAQRVGEDVLSFVGRALRYRTD